MKKRCCFVAQHDTMGIERRTVQQLEVGTMRVKTFTAWTETGLDKKVNEFLQDSSIEIIEVKYASPFFVYSVMILYKQKERGY